MFNVLTDNFKRDIQGQYKKRRVIVWLVAIMCLQVSILILILPSYIYLLAEEKNLLASSSQAIAKDGLANNIDTSKIFQNVNSQLFILSSDLGLKTLNSLISEITSLKDRNIQLREITYQNNTATSSSIILRGIATNRETLLSFFKKIEADDTFYKVDLPISNFAKNKDINFSINISAHI